MMRTFAVISFVAFSGVIFGQAPEVTPAFEIADVHLSATASTTRPPYMTGGVLRAGRYDLRNATMLDMIRTAWGVDPDTIIGGPNWLESDRFDVAAKAPAGTPPDTVKLMLQALLGDRFKLVLHKDTRPMPTFALTAGKGKPKLKEASGQGTAGCQGQPQNPAPGAVPYIFITCRNRTMEAFAPELRLMAGDYLTSPVVDKTELAGSWDFDIKWTGRAQIPQSGSDAITIFDAVDKQLGLRLELQKLPAPVLVVDSVNEKPTANPAGVTESLPPPPPAEFEVADLKLSLPDTKVSGRLQPGGRLDAQGFTLKRLITFAWNINSDDMLAGAPKFLDSTPYDLVAKAYAAGPANAPQVDIDDLRLMVQSLLADRFKLKTHLEDRLVPAYTLAAVKPKLTKADPANRTGCKEAPVVAKDPRDTNPKVSRLVTCQNTSMAQFAEQLQRFAPGYIHNPVVDATGIDGSWDFTLSFSTAGVARNGGAPAAGPVGDAAGPGASDPSGAVTLFDAVNKQLGLKLEMQKRPMPVLVIDHVDEKPTEN